MLLSTLGWPGAGRPRTLEPIHASDAGAATQNLPTVMDGDIGIFIYMINNNPTPANVVPSGWTTISTQGLNFWRVGASYKKLVAADSGAAVTGQTSGSFAGSTLIVLRSFPLCNTLTLSTVNSQATASDPTLQTVDTSGLQNLAAIFGITVHGGAGSNTATGTIATEGGQLNANSARRFFLLSYERSSQFGNKTIDMNQAGDPNVMFSGYLEIT